MPNTSENKLRRLIKLLCHGHAHYEMESNHIQNATRSQGSLKLALENKKAFLHFMAYLVQPYTIVYVNVVGLDR